MTDLDYWYKQAISTSKQIGWLPEVIFTQWQVETAHFTSNNFKKNNNIAGQTWYEGCGYPKGTARPKNEGGYYIKYPDAVDGYVDFIKKNKRYSKVKTMKTAEAQFKEIARSGWATDKNYANTLISVHKSNIRKNIYTTSNHSLKKEYKSIVDFLNDKGLESSFAARKALAIQHGIHDYTGTSSQNIKLLQEVQK